MVRPRTFFSNPQTAASNAFQQRSIAAAAQLAARAQREFDGVVTRLQAAGVEVIAAEGPAADDLPDAIFPNNWFSTHADGTVVLYPMLAENRRRERRPELLAWLQTQHHFDITRLIDLSSLEPAGVFVEGTGSLVFDHVHRVAYACVSPRTTLTGVREACHALNFEPHIFTATDAAGLPIYHTNVMLSVGTELAIGCFDCVRDADEQAMLIEALRSAGKTLVSISEAQMRAFAANVLEMRGHRGGVLALSTRAWAALSESQRRALDSTLHVVPVSIETIEEVGGGGIRCMLAEIFLPLHND